jgi:alpha-L-fucosidase 2
VLLYDKPANPEKWATEGLPIGNGRLGAMLFGGVEHERIQFNENTLWGGANNWDGGFDLSDTGFGGYRNFGDLLISWGGPAGPSVTSPSGHATGNGQPLENTLDDNPATKWCVENPGAKVVWQAELPEARRVTSYAIVSASDVPARDPRRWTLEGSSDGEKWVVLDQRNENGPFAGRGERKSFNVAKPAACSHYRLTFLPEAGASHFQVADIALGGVNMAAKAPSAAPADYRMTLDLARGLHRVAFTDGKGRKITREAFASRPDQVLVFRYEAAKSSAGGLSGAIRLKPGRADGVTLRAERDELAFSGVLSNKLRYAATLRVLHEGGAVVARGETLEFKDCGALTLLLDARTDYRPNHAADWRGDNPVPVVAKGIAAAATKPYAALRAAHVTDFSKLMGGCVVEFGESTPEQSALTTPQRLLRYTDEGRFKSGGDDPGLDAQLFQMGRYLLVSSSRPGGLPANLQGLWNDSNAPAWASDYHNNINIEMNYWPAETTNLGECAEPLLDFVTDQAPACRLATRKAFGDKTRGWTARTSQSPFGGNGWEWNIPASAWYALHVYDHFAFTQDKKFLKETGYPILKEICEYWEDRLKALPDGALVAPNGWSPEHGPREDGVMHDQQLIWELFDDYLKAADALAVDADYRKKIAGLQAHLAPNKIGKWGQLQEWQADRDDPNNRHRHTSHLFALYPGRQISKTGTPELAQAAKVSLLARSNDSSDKTGKPWTPAEMHPESIYGWVWPWRAAMWARLGEGDRAQTLVWGKAGNTAPNMLGLNVPYTHRQELIQLDNSFGVTAAIAEMLLQSHASEIQLLPALPKAWAKSGSFRGLCARGGFKVDCEWKDGRITSATLRGQAGAPVEVRIAGNVEKLTLPKDGVLKLEPASAAVR